MPLKAIPGVTPMSLGNMVENRAKAVLAQCENKDCGRETSIPVEELYARGFTPDDSVIDVGPKLRCPACGHLGTETRPTGEAFSTGQETGPDMRSPALRRERGRVECRDVRGRRDLRSHGRRFTVFALRRTSTKAPPDRLGVLTSGAVTSTRVGVSWPR